VQDASAGLLQDAISVYKDNSMAKELISRKYKHVDENDKVILLKQLILTVSSCIIFFLF